MCASLACQPALRGTAACPTTAAVPATGTGRRLQALAFMGHSVPALAGRLGVPERSVRRLQAGKAALVPLPLARAVSALYNALWDVGGQSAASVRMARRQGWCPPLAWDDNPSDPHWIDDPAAAPADWRPRCHLTAAQRGEEIAALMALGCTPVEAAWRLGITRDALDQRRRRARAQEGAARS